MAGQAQISTFVTTTAYRYADYDPNVVFGFPLLGVVPGCGAALPPGNGALSVTVPPCAIPTIPDGVPGTATMSSSASVVPAAGQFKSGVEITASGFPLSQFVPTYSEETGERVYTDALRPDALGASAHASVFDQFLVRNAPGAAPATLDLFLDFRGTLRAPAFANGLFAYAAAYADFCAGPAGLCHDLDPTNDDQVFKGYAIAYADGNPASLPLQTVVTSPPGTITPTITFTGTASVAADPSNSGTMTTIDGRLTFGNIPIASLHMFDFSFDLSTVVEVRHPTAQLPDCDPRFDPGCGADPPLDFTGTLSPASGPTTRPATTSAGRSSSTSTAGWCWVPPAPSRRCPSPRPSCCWPAASPCSRGAARSDEEHDQVVDRVRPRGDPEPAEARRSAARPTTAR
jgi:hypothetical protein